MVRISKTGATMRQVAYARRVWGGKDSNKRQVALDVGYSRYVAASPKSKIEDRKGFNNALAQLAAESNNLALSILHEFKSRGVGHFTDRDLIGALNAIGQAWSKFNKPMEDNSNMDAGKNRLRTVVLQQIENQTMNTGTIRNLPPNSSIQTPVDELDF